MQAQFTHLLLDHMGPADQDRARQVLIDHHLGRAQHPVVLALGVADPLVDFRRGREDRLHDRAGAVDEAAELVAVGLHVGDRPGGDAGLHGRFRDRRGDGRDQARVERARDQVFRAERLLRP